MSQQSELVNLVEVVERMNVARRKRDKLYEDWQRINAQVQEAEGEFEQAEDKLRQLLGNEAAFGHGGKMYYVSNDELRCREIIEQEVGHGEGEETCSQEGSKEELSICEEGSEEAQVEASDRLRADRQADGVGEEPSA